MRFRPMCLALAAISLAACGDSTAPSPVLIRVLADSHEVFISEGQTYVLSVTTIVTGPDVVNRSDTTAFNVDIVSALEVVKLSWDRSDGFDDMANQPTKIITERYRIRPKLPATTKITFRSPYDKNAYDVVNVFVLTKG